MSEIVGERFLVARFAMPTRQQTAVSEEEAARYLNANAALWHPRALKGAPSLPQSILLPDLKAAERGQLYVLASDLPREIAGAWLEQARVAGALVLSATADRKQTLRDLEQLLTEFDVATDLASSPEELVESFVALGFGVLQVHALLEAMDHQDVLSLTELQQDVRDALGALKRHDDVQSRAHLTDAAKRLRAARDAVYPAEIYLLEVLVLDAVSEAESSDEQQPRPFTLTATGAELLELATRQPDYVEKLRDRVSQDIIEICSGRFLNRRDSWLPLESIAWNLVRGLQVTWQLFDREVRSFAGNEAVSNSVAGVLVAAGFSSAVIIEEINKNSQRSTVSFCEPASGKQVAVLHVDGQTAENPSTFIHLAYSLYRTIMSDFSATLTLVRRKSSRDAAYTDWQKLDDLCPIFGKWTTVSRYLDQVSESQTSASIPFAEPAVRGSAGVESRETMAKLARHYRLRRALDSAFILTGMYRAIVGERDDLGLAERIHSAEEQLERGEDSEAVLAVLCDEAARALAARLQSSASRDLPGFMLFNPCSFARRAAVHISDFEGALPVGGPVRASQLDGSVARLVVDLPGLGYAWIGNTGPGAAVAGRQDLADQWHVRNEFFEAEIDASTGGLRTFADRRGRGSGIRQELISSVGSIMRARQLTVGSSGPALGEIVSEGDILVDGQAAASFRQIFRAWAGRPILEIEIELAAKRVPVVEGQTPYLASRLTWTDEMIRLSCECQGHGALLEDEWFEAPQFFHLQRGAVKTLVITGGLTLQRRAQRQAVDMLLLKAGEASGIFKLAQALNQEFPYHAAQAFVTPMVAVPVFKGPPAVGAAAWIFHVGAANALLTGLKPLAGNLHGVEARLLECGGFPGPVELRSVRRPLRAAILDLCGNVIREARCHGDTVVVPIEPEEYIQVKVEY
jgi:alpha-mannosidase